VLQLRVVCPDDVTDAAVARLRDDIGVATIGLHRGASIVPRGDVLECEVARERINSVIEALRALGVERRGAISIVEVDALASTAEHETERLAPGYEADAVPWPLVEDTARDNAQPAATFFVLMALAAIIAAVGIVIDSAVLIIGAMIVGPEYGPLTAVAVGLHRRKPFWRPAAAVLVSGLLVAIAAAAATAAIASAFGERSSSFEPTSRFFTSFVTDPNAYSAVVALVAGVAGTVALARSQATALAGVLVSVTTIPAAAAVGVDLATAHWADCGHAALQLTINVAALLVASQATLVVYDRLWGGFTRPSRRRRRSP
jgi:uncharacterized hydrophobic protein (TIGR00271 family)